MGNCFGKVRGNNNFKGQGRTLGDAPIPAPAPSSAPTAKVPPGPGRRLGSQKDGQESPTDIPKSAAARAAEERLKASQGKGKLGKQLDAQKSKTQAETLAEASMENRAARENDAINESRAYN